MKEKPPPGSRRTGFTLIELLVVIAIIAVLASLLVPAVQTALGRGRAIACSSNMRTIGQGMASMMLSGTPVLGVDYFPGYAGRKDDGSHYTWWSLIAEQVGTETEPVPGEGEDFTPGRPSFLRCPQAQNYDKNWTYHGFTYGYNYVQLGDWISPQTRKAALRQGKVMRGEQLTLPVGTVVVTDSNEDDFYDSQSWPAWPGAVPGYRHNGSCNVLYADWHVAATDDRAYLNNWDWDGPWRAIRK